MTAHIKKLTPAQIIALGFVLLILIGSVLLSHKPEELITKIVEKKVPVYHEEGGQKESLSSGEKEGVWHVIYKHLIISHLQLPFVWENCWV